jgi:RimJ/RimL family protein N-acetyltransferase
MSDFTIRPVTMEDAKTILEWRNDPETRSRSFTQDVIDPDTHMNWFGRKMQDPACLLFMLEDQGRAVGHIRIDSVGDVGEISYMIDPAKRGKGYGTVILSEIESALPENLHVLMGMVQENNIPSQKCFAKNGYAEFDAAGIKCYIKSLR